MGIEYVQNGLHIVIFGNAFSEDRSWGCSKLNVYYSIILEVLQHGPGGVPKLINRGSPHTSMSTDILDARQITAKAIDI